MLIVLVFEIVLWVFGWFIVMVRIVFCCLWIKKVVMLFLCVLCCGILCCGLKFSIVMMVGGGKFCFIYVEGLCWLLWRGWDEWKCG